MFRFLSRKKKKVIVLGAGLAGLTAAYRLKQKRFDVVVLEARNRPGGRVDTRVIESDPALTIEMGGEWVGSKHLAIRRLIRELGLKLRQHRLKTALLRDGKYHKPNEWKFSAHWKQKLKELLKNLPKLSKEEIKRLQDIDWWHFLVTNHIPRKDIEIIDLIDSTDYGEDIRFVSSYNVLSDYSDGFADDVSCTHIVDGGNSKLVDSLIKKIGKEDIKLDKKVHLVEQTSNGVKVSCEDGSSFMGQKVICTLPAYSVANIVWHPGLPTEKMDAFKSLDYCRIIKISVLFSDRFWDEDLEIATDTLADFIYHSTQNQKGKQGVLTSYAVGDRAYVLSNMNDEERLEAICKALSIPFGSVKDKAIKVISYYWGDDPYTKGAYAIFEKTHQKELRDLLRASYQNVFFAGEHTADFPGFMEGAVESGERAAQEVVESWKK